MDVYHGTTEARARGIFNRGLLPLPPSRKVWFAESRAYAMNRARTQARRTNDVPVVLACRLDLDVIRRHMGGRGVLHKKGIVAIDGPVTVEMMHSITLADLATVPAEVAAWVNRLLGLAREKAVEPKHPGVIRLSRWINARIASEDGATLLSSELVERARRWLPEYFVGARLGTKTLRAHSRVGLTEYEVDERRPRANSREPEALECLDDPRPDERARGLSLLAEVAAPDLFDWCAMFLDDEAVAVRVAALRAMLQCADIAAEVVEPLAESEDRRVRGAAVAVLAKHSAEDSSAWIRRGLEDPEPCVRVEAARFLGRLHPRRDREVLILASHDPNADIAGRARQYLKGRRR